MALWSSLCLHSLHLMNDSWQRGSLTVSPMISMQSGQTNSVHRPQHGHLNWKCSCVLVRNSLWMPYFGTVGVEMARTCFSICPDKRSKASQMALVSISSNSSRTSSETGMDFRFESPRLPRMYRTLVPVDFRPTVLVSTNS